MTFPFLQKSFANIFRKKERHARIQKTKPILLNWVEIERNLSPEEKKQEQHFFYKSVATFFLGFLFISSVPYLQRLDKDFWPISENTSFFSTSFSFADEGFFAKANIPTVEIGVKSDRSQMNDVFEYTIENGDSLYRIADKFGIRVKTILDNNEIPSSNIIKKGDILKILPVDGLLVLAKKGDTISGIAKEYGVSAEDIIRQNQLEHNQNLDIGQKVIIPGAKKKEVVIVAKPKVSIPKSKSSSSSNVPSFQLGRPNKLLFPTQGIITQKYHYGHYAIDIGNQSRPGVVAAADGVVIKAEDGGWNSGYGNMIIIDHGGGMQTLYAHNEKVYVKVGETVKAGQVISKMGNSGKVYGPTGIHLHFEVRINGTKKNPMEFF